MTCTSASVPYAASGLKAASSTLTSGNTGTTCSGISVRGIVCGNMTRKEAKRVRKVAVYAGTRNLYEVMKTAVTSLLQNNSMDDVYLLIEDEAYPYEMPENVHIINVQDQTYFPEDGANFKNRWTYMCMIRLALTMILPKEDKLLWLDCDTIVDADISELFAIDMDGYYIAGVKEIRKEGWQDYINAGVLLMNLDAIRTDGLDKKLIDLVNTKKLECPDQDAINTLAKGKIRFIPSEYNVCPFTEPPERLKIYHYAARVIFDNDPMYRKYSGHDTPIRTLVAIPCLEMVHADFMKSVVEMDKPENTSIATIKNTLIYNARNMIADNAIRYGFDRVLWLDSDMIIPKDALMKLSADMDKGYDFVSAVYFMRKFPTAPVVYSDVWYKVTDNEASAGATNVINIPERIFECAGSGFGCVMTSVTMLKALTERYGAPFTPMMGISEDLAFCWRAKHNGFGLYCDGRIKCGHIGSYVYTGDDYK